MSSEQLTSIQDVVVFDVFKLYKDISERVWNYSEDENIQEFSNFLISQIESKIISSNFVFNLIFVVSLFRPRIIRQMNQITSIISKKYVKPYRDFASTASFTNLNVFISQKISNIIFNDDSDALNSYIINSNGEIKIEFLKEACRLGSINCFKYLIMNFDGPLDDLAKFAVASGNLEIIRILSQKGVDFNNCFKIAIHSNHNEIADWLLENNSENNCSIYDAYVAKNYEAISYFINKGVEQNENVDFLVFMASEENCFDIVKFLHEKGYSISGINVIQYCI
ncbi:hypothetical protein TVAG_139130 [Trichomonas vaginalis G3]|uniref:DUF3447 domain-containing protein n=1 Tax=Trichomonas vaginalis (strain ATCC PRA-98 / G3) TaxID=412133 RepID=A2E487_TRIV3|nr:spectrin binding [Trichomonas vaginalis G3]EAY12533.1 hypothetical protein TVAG_139130 [Trichomonas vaginalis G3]KAI5554071.1 spectrin binding [Trichomonas vaginalis G3]|eukprot:XP_001324756.1 hypothetical protein [Trichomonas vaginalis G3]